MRRFERQTDEISGNVGHYRVESAVRSTAERTVYAARETAVDRRVELHVSHEHQEDFLTHAHRLSALKDPYLLPVYEVGVHDGHAFAAAASPGKETLEQRLRSGPIPYQHALRLAGDLVTPLETLERAGLPIGEIPDSAVALQGERALLAPLEIEGPERPQEDGSTGVALAGMLRSMIGTDDVPLELEALLADPPESAAELLKRARDLSAPPRSRKPRVPFAAVAAALAAAAVAVILLAGGDDKIAPQASPDTAAGRLAATIPLGAQPTSVAVDGDAVWVGTTAGTLIRVDPNTNRVVGEPIEVTGENVTNGTVTAGEGAVFLITGNRLHRIDPTTGEVTARRQIDGRALGATVAGGQLWITRLARPGNRDRTATVERFDARTLAPVGSPLPTEDFPQDVDVSGAIAWVANSAAGSITRADTKAGTSTSSTIGGLPGAGVIDAGRYWVTDFGGGYITAIDTATGRHDGIVRVPDPVSITAGGGALWVTSVPGTTSDASARLVRVDPLKRTVIGDPVELGPDVGWPAFGHGSVWVYSRPKRALLRIEPTTPASPAQPAASTPKDALTSGPLAPGTKRSERFAVPFDITLRDDGWLGIVARDSYAAVSRTAPTHATAGLVLPESSIAPDGSVSKITSARDLERDLRGDPRLTVTPLPSASVGGTPSIGLRVAARADATPVPAYCNRVCVPVLKAGLLTITIDEGVDQELRIFERGGRVVVATLTAPSGSPELARVRAALATLRFR